MAAKKKSAKLLRCPTCAMLVTFDGEDFPFCSDRCRKIDLGKWASGVYKISSPSSTPKSSKTSAPLAAATRTATTRMKTRSKFLCLSSLAVAGSLSILLTLLGLFAFAWAGLPKNSFDAQALGLFLPLVFAFPFFALAVAVTRYASLALWIMAASAWIVMVRVSMRGFHGGPIDLLTVLVVSSFQAIPLLLLLLAALVQLSTHFYEFTHDGRWVRWREGTHA